MVTTTSPREAVPAATASSRSAARPWPPTVTIVMPALNEEAYVANAVRSILPSRARMACELLVVDGGSSDRTAEIVRALAAEDDRIRLVHNDKRIQSAAVNAGARLADPHSRFILRADCHSHYPPDFVEGCISTLERRGAASVVVPMRTVGKTCMQRAIAAARNSRLGNGGSRHRVAGRSGFVEHGHHAAFDRKIFLEAGGYDERFSHNEDAELDIRLVQGGHRIYLDAGLTIAYYPRATLPALARQYHNFGWGRANTLVKHRTRPQLRQLAPVLLLAILSLTLAVAATTDARALLVPAAYVALMLGWGAALAARRRNPCLVMIGPAVMVMHLAWGAGFVRRLVGLRQGRRANPPLGASTSQGAS